MRASLRPVLAELTRLPVVERIELQPMDEGEVPQLFTAIRGSLPRPAGLWTELSESYWMAGFDDEAIAASEQIMEILGGVRPDR